MALSQQVQEELAIMSVAISGAVLQHMASGRPHPMSGALIQRLQALLGQAQQEFNAGTPFGDHDGPVRASAHVQDAGFPRIVCLCGPVKFAETFAKLYEQESLAGQVVLTVVRGDGRDRESLDELHLRKIELADDVLIVNVGGYMGADTRRELAYAIERGKRVRFYDEEAGRKYLDGGA